MPVYVYECQKCGHGFEIEQGINDPPKQKCPECRGKVNKVYSSVGIVFKGSGFYCTDNHKKTAQVGGKSGNGGNGGASCGSCEASGGCAAAASKKADD